MNEHVSKKDPPSQGKILAVAYSAAAVFTAISILVPIIWERINRKETEKL